MRKKLINKNDISPSCSYCAHGRPAPDGENILCKKYGIVENDYACKKFSYDVLKRRPKRPLPLSSFKPEDFSL